MCFTNYYNTYIKKYAELASKLQDNLKVPRSIGKKGSMTKVEFDEEDLRIFEELKKKFVFRIGVTKSEPRQTFCFTGGRKWIRSGGDPGATQEK